MSPLYYLLFLYRFLLYCNKLFAQKIGAGRGLVENTNGCHLGQDGAVFARKEFIKGERMQNNRFVVLDIGSGKLRLAELEFDEGNRELEKFAEVDYAGFTDGSFIEDDLLDACSNLFEGVERDEVSCVYVGVPSEFCGQVVLDRTCTFDSPIDLSGKTRREFLKYSEIDE